MYELLVAILTWVHKLVKSGYNKIILENYTDDNNNNTNKLIYGDLHRTYVLNYISCEA